MRRKIKQRDLKYEIKNTYVIFEDFYWWNYYSWVLEGSNQSVNWCSRI